MAKVAIIGAGISGLLAAKSCIEVGLVPVVFERKNNVGGVWHSTQGYIWDSMTTNVSKYQHQLSELPWSATDPIFPHHSVILKYIEEYYKIYNLDKHLLFNTKVIKAEKVEQENKQFPKWNIHYLNLTTNNKKCEMFDDFIIKQPLPND